MQPYIFFKKLLLGILLSSAGLFTNAQNVSLSISSPSIDEAGGSSTITATAVPPGLSEISVNLVFTGTATNGTDYASVNTIVIPAGAPTGSVTITAQEDTQYELNETIIVDITSVTNGNPGAVTQVSTTITDNDAPPTVTLTSPTTILNENGGAADISATLSNTTYQYITVTITPQDVSTSSGDYDLGTTQIVIPPGMTSNSTTLTPFDDTASEGPETLNVDITGVSAGATEDGEQSVGFTINDPEDNPTVTLSAIPDSFDENGGSSNITANLSVPTYQDITVTIGTQDITTTSTDYNLPNNQIVIASGTTSGFTTISGTDDAVSEGPETLSAFITIVSTGASEDGEQSVELTINDPEDNPTVTLSADPVSFNENGGSSNITATLSAQTYQDITVTIGTVEGTAIMGDISLPDNQIIISAGNTSNFTTVSGSDDTVSEGPETFSAVITTVSAGASEDGEQSVELTINDPEDNPTVTLSADPVSFNENGGSSAITATLSVPTYQDITVTIGTVEGTATMGDISLPDNQIIISAGNTSNFTTIYGSDDAVSEGPETFSAVITNVSAGASEDGEQSVELTINDPEDNPTVTLSADPVSFNENGGSSTITATLTGVTYQDITVTINAVNGTASGLDYDLENTEILIESGSLTGTTTISGEDDDISEGSETLSIDIISVSAGATEDSEQSVPLTINDDEGVPVVSLTATPLSFAEDESTTLTAELSNPTTENITVTLQTTNTSAEPSDYDLTPETITIIGGITSGTRTLNGVPDNLYEGDETLSVAITGISSGTASIGSNNSVSLTITDLQSPPVVTLSANPLTIGEDGISTITATANIAAEESISVSIDVTGGSAEEEDYNLTSYSISVPANSTEGTTTLEGVSDNVYEGNETVDISITEVTGASAQIGNPQSVTITLSDNQTAPSVTLSASPLSINEGESSTITATLNTAASEDVIISLSVTDGDTGAGDYTLSSNSIVVTAGNLSGTTTLSAQTDGLFEGDESLSVDISEVSGGSASTGSPASVSLTIIDSQTAPLARLSASPLSLNEGGTATVTATLTTATNQDVTVTLNIINQTTESEDYTLRSDNITIPAGSLFASTTFEAIDDAVFENNESLIIEITAIAGGSATEDGDQTVSITIVDNESAPTVSLSASPINIPEDGTSTLTATLSTATYEDITVTISPAIGSIENEDFILGSNTIIIPAGELTGTTTVRGIDDNIFEGNETFDFEIITVSGGGATENGDQSATIILNDDELPPTVSLSAFPLSIPEDGSSVLTVSLSNPTFENVLVNLSHTGGTAGSNDFNLATRAIIIPAGENSATTRLDGLPDALYEGDEDITVEISAVGGGSATEDGTQLVTITIEDAQSIPSASLELSGSPFSEDNGTAYITVRLNHASVQNVEIALLYEGTASTSDYSGSSSSVEITAGRTEEMISLSGINDAEAEGEETIIVSIESVTNGVEDGDQSVTATILDDDVVGIKPGITGAGTTTSEAGTFDNFNVMLNTRPASDVVIEITGIDTSEGSVSPTTLTFTPANWNVNQIVTVTGVDDNEVDGDITYTLTLEVVNRSSDPAYHNVSTTVEVTNTDNDAAGFTLSITNSDTQTTESGDSDVFSLVLNSRPTSNVVFNITGLDPTEGALSTDEVTFTPANWNQLQNITITGIDDDLVDGNITYMLTISVDDARSDATYHGQSETLDVTNTDDDSAGISVNITGANTQTSESGTTDTFDVVLSSQPQSDVVIGISDVDESEIAISINQLSFSTINWNQPQTVTVTGVDDNLVDGNITFALSLTVDNSLSDPAYHDQSLNINVTNTDDDAAGISIIESNGNTITSENGETDSFEVSLTSLPESNVVIDIQGLVTSEGILNTNTLTFSPGNWDQPQTVSITGVDDDILDGDISYTLNLSVNNNNSDDTYDGLIESVVVTNIDNEIENQAPEPAADEYTMDEGTILQDSSLLANDVEPDGDEISINTTPVTPPANGILEISNDGTFTYQPYDGFTGTDSFEYEVCDNGSTQLCATALVTITVMEVDPDPDNDGIPTEEEGYGDADNDGIPNYLDTDSDNDGIPDGEEGSFDCDNDGIADRLDPDPCFKVKEAFSPNNDGINDIFVIPWASRYDKVSLVIFNRWGSVVFSADDYQNNWEGEASSGLSKGKGLPAGTYYYIVTIHDINKKISGYFYLNR